MKYLIELYSYNPSCTMSLALLVISYLYKFADPPVAICSTFLFFICDIFKAHISNELTLS